MKSNIKTLKIKIMMKIFPNKCWMISDKIQAVAVVLIQMKKVKIIKINHINILVNKLFKSTHFQKN